MKALIGLELHQRLATGKKLFCNCKNKISTEPPIATIMRRLRAVPSELGKVDPAALFEMNRGREFVYQLFEDTTCEVEIDESPPRELNQEALEIAIEIALLLNARILDEVHVMRKQVLDGSANSSFQRTVLIAINGKIETSKGIVNIPTISLEEESAGIVSQSEKKVAYRLDRQGIPLIEIATAPQIVNGEHAREVAEKIGLLLRSTGKVARGIGTIRQDLNVSLEGGARIEVKGVQELGLLQKIIEFELNRQRQLLAKGERVKPETRKAVGDRTEFMRPLPGAARMYPETDVPPIVLSRELIERARKALPPSIEEREKKLLSIGLSKQLAEKLLLSQELELFESIIKKTGVDATLVATTLLETMVSLRRQAIAVESISEETLVELFKAFKSSIFVKQAIPDILAFLAASKGSLINAVKEKGLHAFTRKELLDLIAKYRKQGVLDEKAVFADIMRKHRLNVDAIELKKLLGL